MDQTGGRIDARESLHDIAHNVERWVDVMVLRTFAHSTVEDMAAHASIPVINALSDLEHPCQALADYSVLQERFGNLKNVTLAYVGDGNNVAHSLLLTGALLGSRVRVATPQDTNRTRTFWAPPRKLRRKRARQLECFHRSASSRRRCRRGLYRCLGEHGAGARIRHAGLRYFSPIR